MTLAVPTEPRATAAPELPGFAELGCADEDRRRPRAQSITLPFPISRRRFPTHSPGRDILGRGVTGSGKTLAFAIPTVANIAAAGGRSKPGHPRALVLVPTRELARPGGLRHRAAGDLTVASLHTVFGACRRLARSTRCGPASTSYRLPSVASRT
jgi:hypothetical protein